MERAAISVGTACQNDAAHYTSDKRTIDDCGVRCRVDRPDDRREPPVGAFRKVLTRAVSQIDARYGEASRTLHPHDRYPERAFISLDRLLGRPLSEPLIENWFEFVKVFPAVTDEIRAA